MAVPAASTLDPAGEPSPSPATQPAAAGASQPSSSRRSAQLDTIFTALVAAQTELVDPDVDQSNPDYADHRYASLPSFLVPNRAILQKHGLAVLQTPDGDALVTMLVHASGQFIEGRTPLLLVSADMQGLGSAISYARRYGYQSILGLVQIDDDARRALKPASPGSGANVSANGSPTATATVMPIRPTQGGVSGAGAAAAPARTSGFNVQATVDAIKKKSLVSELDVALARVRTLFTGTDLEALEKAITDRRAEIESASAAALP